MQTHPLTAMYVVTGLHGGGAERLLTNVLLQQSARGDALSVVSLMPGGVFRRTLEDAGIDVTDLGMTRHRHALRGAFRLAALIRRRRPAVVHGWMHHANLLALAALVLARRPRTRLFWGIFCSDVTKGSHWTFPLIGALSRLLSRFVAGVIYNAPEARDYHHRAGFRERRSIVIPNCVDPETFRHDRQLHGAFRAELGIGADVVVVAVVARVDPMKDWDTVRDAVRDLPGVVTVAVGKGTDELPPQAGFIGLGWRDDVLPMFSAADIFLLGSAFGEGASLAVNEAMLCSLPCIVTDVGGNSGLVGDAGIVVKPRNAESIRKAILQLVNDRERRGAMGRAARERAAAAISCDDTVRRLRLLSLTPELGPEAI